MMKTLEKKKKAHSIQHVQTPPQQHSITAIYILLGISGHLEMIQDVQEDVFRLYANILPFSIREYDDQRIVECRHALLDFTERLNCFLR